MTVEALIHIEKALSHLADAGVLLRRRARENRERCREAEAVDAAEVILDRLTREAELAVGEIEYQVAGMMGGSC